MVILFNPGVVGSAVLARPLSCARIYARAVFGRCLYRVSEAVELSILGPKALVMATYHV